MLFWQEAKCKELIAKLLKHSMREHHEIDTTCNNLNAIVRQFCILITLKNVTNYSHFKMTKTIMY